MIARKKFILSFLICFQAISLYADVIDEFRKFAVQQMKEDQVPGMTIGYIRWGDGDDRIWTEAFGYSDLENQVVTRPNTAYRLGSVSKTMTAAAVLLLAEQGKIDLDAEVQTYVPYFPKKQWPITVRQLLGHLGGISHYKNYDTEGRIKEHKNTREAIAIFENFDLVAEPGTKYSYSSYGYNLLAAVVEGASKMPFGKFMTENIWKQLGMQDTRLDDPAELIPNRPRGYRIQRGQIKNSEFVDMSSRLGAGGTRSTVPDLLKFARGLIAGKLLTSRNVNLIYESMATRDGHFVDYSAGWGLRATNGHFHLRHTGSQQETSTILMIFPALKLAIACAVNQEDAGASVFANRLFELLMQEPYGLVAYVAGARETYRAIDLIFSSGMAHYEFHGKPVAEDPEELRKAFEYFKNSITAEPTRAKKLIDDGVHPVSKRSYAKVGSFIAKRIAEEKGETQLKRYHATGAIPFFADYVKACNKKKKDFACAFSPAFEKLIAQWDQSWSRTYGEMARLRISADSNLDEIGTRMRNSVRSASAYPDFSRALSDLTWNFLLKGANEKSLQAGELGISLYPDSPRILALYGISLAALSDQKRGLALLKKAYQLDPESPAEPDWLTDFAEELANAGKIDQALNVMKTAVELHPKNPTVLIDMGEAYRMLQQPEKAREYFERVLAIDPKNDRAKTALQKP